MERKAENPVVCLKFGWKANKLSSWHPSLEAVASCQGVLLEQVKLVLEQVLPENEEEFLCSCSCCVQILYWPSLVQGDYKKQQLHRVLYDRFLHGMLCGGKACCLSKQISQLAAMSLF